MLPLIANLVSGGVQHNYAGRSHSGALGDCGPNRMALPKVGFSTYPSANKNRHGLGYVMGPGDRWPRGRILSKTSLQGQTVFHQHCGPSSAPTATAFRHGGGFLWCGRTLWVAAGVAACAWVLNGKAMAEAAQEYANACKGNSVCKRFQRQLDLTCWPTCAGHGIEDWDAIPEEEEVSAPAPSQQEAGSSGGGDQAADDFAAPGAPAGGGLQTEPSLAVGSAEVCMAMQAVVVRV